MEYYIKKGGIILKYCQLCQRHVDPVKSKWSWGWFIVYCVTLVGGVFYAIYHAVFKPKNRCPICQTNKLLDRSPEEQIQLDQRKAEKREQREETISNMANTIKKKLDGTQ